MTTTTTDPAEAIQLLAVALIKARGADDAIALLREVLDEETDGGADDCPAMGCCGCGAWVADVRIPSNGEMYCWACVPELHSGTEYAVLPGRSAPGTVGWQIENAPAGSKYGAPDLRSNND